MANAGTSGGNGRPNNRKTGTRAAPDNDLLFTVGIYRNYRRVYRLRRGRFGVEFDGDALHPFDAAKPESTEPEVTWLEVGRRADGTVVASRVLPTLTLSGIVQPIRKAQQGQLIRATGLVWETIVDMLWKDWQLAFQIPAEQWEEIVAGAFDRAGFDEVVLTPRSGDHGRDVIAIRKGVGSIKIIGSVKAYKPGHLVKHDDVRALLGVLAGEQNASKGIITTTSDFAPRVVSDPFISPFLPTRLELINGEKLLKWLTELRKDS